MKFLKYFFILLYCGIGFRVAAQGPFTPGNIAVYRVGDGSATLTANASAVFLDEYTPSGTLVQSIPLPSTGAKKITYGNTANTGFLTLSANGKYLVVPGYNADLGTDVSTANAERSIGLIDFNGAVNGITTLPSGSFITSAASDDGTNLWFSGNTAGLEYTTAGVSTPITVSGLNGATSMSVNIANGQLYTNLNGGGIGLVGSGLPTTAGQSFTGLPGNADINHLQFVFADLEATVPGVDVLYAASGGATDGGLKKYSLVNGNWVLNGTIGTRNDRYSGIAVKVSGTSVTIFATRLGSNNTTIRGGALVSLTDNSGYNGTFSGTPTVLATVTTPNTKAFRGVAKVPVGCQPVSAVRVPDISASQAVLFWNAPLNGGGNYEYAVTTSLIPPVTGAATSSTTVNVTGLNNATTYYAHVRAVCSSSNRSEWSTISFMTGCKAPAVPTVNIAVGNTGIVSIKWNKVFGADSYEYYISNSSNPPSSGTAVNDTSITISTLNAVTKYYLHVRSLCGGGAVSSWITKEFTTACFSPSPNVSVLEGSAGVKWNKVPNAVRYEVSLSHNPTKPVSGTFINDTVYLINKAHEGSAYYFHIRTTCPAGSLSDWNTIPFNIQGLQVYPNPVQDDLQIKLNGVVSSAAEITISDVMGRVVTRLRLNSNQATVKMMGWSSGVYFVRYNDGANKYLVKIVKR